MLRVHELEVGPLVAQRAVAVHLDAAVGRGPAHAPQGGRHREDGAVFVEGDAVYAHRTVLVESGGVVVVMVEQIPLSFVADNGVVVGPAFAGGLRHDDTFEYIGPQRAVTHGIGQRLGLVLHPGIGEVEPALAFKDERAFLETLRKRGVQPDGASRKLREIVFHGCTGQSHAGPVQVRLPVRGLQHAGIDAEDAGDGLLAGRIGSFGPIGRRYANREAVSLLRCVGEDEIVFPVLLHAVRRPHGVSVGFAPGNVFLGEDDAVVRPVHQVFRGEDVVVGHGKPFPFGFHRADDVVGREEPDLAPENAGGRVCRVLVPDDGILGKEARKQQRGCKEGKK